MIKIGIGPAYRSHIPSAVYYQKVWEEIAKLPDVKSVGSCGETKSAKERIKGFDVIIAVKKLLWITKMCRPEICPPVIYLPVDQFREESDIYGRTSLFRPVKAVACSNEIVASVINRRVYKNRGIVEIVNHPVVHMFDPAPYSKRDGAFLFCGMPYYCKHAMSCIKSAGISKYDVLTKLTSAAPAGAVQWTPELYTKKLSSCVAAFDVKDGSFWQQTKPLTKVSEYLCSGAPAVVNRGHPALKFFESRYGLSIPTIDSERWKSEDYFNEVQEWRSANKSDFSPGSIARKLLDLVELVT